MPIEKACENCGQPFFSFPSDSRRYCSLACRSAKRFGKPDVAPGRQIVRFVCKECQAPFGMMQAYLDAYRKKHAQEPLYCSRKCSNVGRMKDATIRSAFTCETCGKITEKRRKPGGRIYAQQKYCSPECRHEMIRRKAYTRFQSGDIKKHVKRHGYVWMSIPALANNGKKTEMLEHRWVMSQHIGRDLFSEETVHHIDGVRDHNDISNLELFSSRHGPGQRVVDKVQFAIEILTLYPEFAAQAGYALTKLDHVNAEAAAPELQPGHS